MIDQIYRLVTQDGTVEYKLRRSTRVRRLRLTVYRDASIVVTLPRRISPLIAQKFVKEKALWLLDKVNNFRQNKTAVINKPNKTEYLANKAAALEFVKGRLEHLNKYMQLPYKKISIKNQQTRWGSCSRQGNLNFSFRLLYLPSRLSEYIIVHELCHLKEFNHSKRFWKMVESVIPDYKERRQELRSI